MFLPAALVEVSIGTLRPEFFQLCQSLHLIHYDFTDVVLVGNTTLTNVHAGVGSRFSRSLRQKGISEFVESGAVGTLGSRS